MKKTNALSVGLDLGSHMAKAVLLDVSSPKPALKGVKRFPVSVDDYLLSRSQMVDALRHELYGWVAESAHVTLGISGKDVVVRYLEMPKMNLEELKSSLQFEAERYIPFKLTEACFDAAILKEQGENSTKIWVALVAAKKGLVEDRLALLKEAGLPLVCVDSLATALINSFLAFAPSEDTRKGIFMIDVGANFSTCNILVEGIPFLSREIEFGGETLTQILQKDLGKTRTEVEELKMAGKIPLEGNVLEAAKGLVKELVTSFDYFEGISDKTVEVIYLCGGSALLTGLAPFLETQLNRPVQIFNPAARLQIQLEDGKSGNEFEACSHLFAGALGLALRGKAAHD